MISLSPQETISAPNMISAHFKSTSPQPLKFVVLAFLDRVPAERPGVEINLMAFSFTNAEIRDRLVDMAARFPHLRIRLLVDWGLVAPGKGNLVRELAEGGPANLEVRFKYDQPYKWNRQLGQLAWDYNKSLGLLHHRTISVSVDGQPIQMLLGSYNWTQRGENNYENLVEIAPETGEELRILKEFDNEFFAMWDNPALALPLAKALAQKDAFHQALSHASSSIVHPRSLRHPFIPRHQLDHLKEPLTGDLVLAFSSKRPDEEVARNGFSGSGKQRHFFMMKGNGKEKKVPISLTTLALDVLHRAQPGEEVLIAMFAFSKRVADYTALLDRVRLGVRARLIVDRQVSGDFGRELQAKAQAEELPLEVRMGTRCMHQKYMVNPSRGMVLTGTANSTTDAIQRHCDHRLLVRNRMELAGKFREDFETMWNRIQPL